jgi:hypothetical protein
MIGSKDFTARKIDAGWNAVGCNWQNSIFWLLCIAAVIHIGCVLILASVPPISRDALIHHLAIPKMYLLHGGMYEIPSMHYSYFPMNIDLLYLLPLYFKNEIAAKYIHFIFAILTAGLLYRYLKDALDRTYGLIGALFFLTIPVIVKLSVTVYVDLGLILFSWACLYFYLKWYDNNFRIRYLVLSGIACGLALGTKYNGLILLVVMSALVPIGYSLKTNNGLPRGYYRKRYRNSFKGLKWGIGFGLIALIIFSPWMIRNTIWKQNPVYPLFNNVFNPPEQVVKSSLPEEKKTPRNAFWMRRHVYNESFAQTLAIPVRAFFQGQDDNPKYFDGKLNPFLLLLPLMAFVRVREKNLTTLKAHRTIFAVFVLLFILFVFFRVDFRIRYMAPAIPPLIMLSMFGLKNLVDHISQKTDGVRKVGWVAVTVVMGFMFLYNGFYIYDQFGYIRPWDYLLGKVDRDTYISRYRKEHPAIQHANRVLPTDARVLCVSIGDRVYYLDRSVHLAEDFYNKKDGQYLESEQLRKIKRYGTTHIIIDKKLFLNWSRVLKKEDRAIFARVFQNYTQMLYEKNGVVLLEFIHDDNATHPVTPIGF